MTAETVRTYGGWRERKGFGVAGLDGRGTAALIGGTCRIHEWPVCCGFLTKNPQHTGHYDICRNTGGNQPCTLPPCALRYPKFIISLL